MRAAALAAALALAAAASPARAGGIAGLPAVDYDHKRIALPVLRMVDGNPEDGVIVAHLGKTTGEYLAVDRPAETPACNRDSMQNCEPRPPSQNDHTAEVEARLRAYTSVPFAASGTIQDVTLSVSGSKTRKTATFSVGKTRLARIVVRATDVEVNVLGFALVRTTARAGWLYLQVEDVDAQGFAHPQRWLAVKTKLPPRNEKM